MPESNHRYETAIVGCGPAGLSAAINAKIRNKDLVLLGVEFCTPKLHAAPLVENYLGFPAISGEKLREAFLGHAHHMGIDILHARVDSIIPDGEGFTLVTKEGNFSAQTVVLATGVAVTKYLPGERELVGRGVSYCATCDGPLYRGRRVAVLAWEKEAEEEANYLAELAGEVYFLPQYEGELAGLDPKITVIRDEPVAITGEQRVSSLQLKGQELKVDGIFISRETTPTEQLLLGLEMEGPHIKVNRQMETSIPGVFAAGDCTGKPYQLAKAVGEGLVAAQSAVRYLDAKKRPKP